MNKDMEATSFFNNLILKHRVLNLKIKRMFTPNFLMKQSLVSLSKPKGEKMQAWRVKAQNQGPKALQANQMAISSTGRPQKEIKSWEATKQIHREELKEELNQ